MQLAKSAKRKPRELAQAIIDALPKSELVARVEIAGPGFINFLLAPAACHAGAAARARPGLRLRPQHACGGGQRVIVEFVSANPTGPLHVGHGRHAAFGATLANLLDAAGFEVHREYYINDAGRQMEILAASVWLRYLECFGEQFPFPSQRLPRRLPAPDRQQARRAARDGRCVRPAAEVFRDLPPDAPAGDKDLYIDAVIARAQGAARRGRLPHRVRPRARRHPRATSARTSRSSASATTSWFSERSLATSGAIDRALERLRGNGVVYEKDGAQWFRATDFGDEKDRVVRARERPQDLFRLRHRLPPATSASAASTG
ncbi:MAG: arginine--tRNA ligase [Comamonadaceae bacterium]|nr:arginine--tRNA ligase [Comamonadaceae bacterium]